MKQQEFMLNSAPFSLVKDRNFNSEGVRLHFSLSKEIAFLIFCEAVLLTY